LHAHDTKETPMPASGDIPTGAPIWIDLLTTDQAQAAEFYGQLFGWTLEAPDDGRDFGGYRNFLKDGVRIAGSMTKPPGHEMPDVWSVYLATTDAKETIDVAEANGATVIVPAQDVDELGRFAMVQDPTGAAIGLWEPGTHRGSGLLAEPGAPCWFELFTRDHPAALRFYETVFGWPVELVADTDEFRYATYGSGQEQRAGIMDASSFLPEGVPAHWSVYLGVEGADATSRLAESLGGRVLDPAQDTPYGRLATLADPSGAVFKIIEDNVSQS
jgi:predicted enzyme related to lactoylglutathione lyase